MQIRSKIILAISLIIVSLLLIPWALTHYFFQPSQPVQTPSIIVDTADPSLVSGEPFALSEGYTIDIPANWELMTHDEERSVDRYRFERTDEAKGIFTISFYEDKKSFDDVIEARYGSGYATEPKAMDIDGKNAMLVRSAFFEQGDTSDVIIQINETSYLSLYGVFLPDGESGQDVKNEIRFIQESFRSL